MDLCEQALREPGPLWPELGHWLGLMYCDSKVLNWSWTSVTRLFVSQDLCDRNLGNDRDLTHWNWNGLDQELETRTLYDMETWLLNTRQWFDSAVFFFCWNDRNLTWWNFTHGRINWNVWERITVTYFSRNRKKWDWETDILFWFLQCLIAGHWTNQDCCEHFTMTGTLTYCDPPRH